MTPKYLLQRRHGLQALLFVAGSQVHAALELRAQVLDDGETDALVGSCYLRERTQKDCDDGCGILSRERLDQ